MKKIILIIVVLTLFGIIFVSKNSGKPITIFPSPSPQLNTITTTNRASQSIPITFNNKEYLVYFTLLSGREITIIPNFEEKKASKTIVNKHNCKAAVNGGFYTKTNKPLGLFIADGKQYGVVSANRSLLTGFFYLDAGGQPHIGSQQNLDSQTIFQAGPLIINSNPFSTSSDEQARRAVLIESTNNKIYGAMVVFNDSAYSGPLLSELPSLLFSIKNPFKVKQALNLDGGSASFFYEKSDVDLTEQTSVGSVICIK